VASQPHLPLLAQAYDEGLQVSGADLGRLHDEVWTLQKRRTEIISADEIRTDDVLGRSVAVPVRAHLSSSGVRTTGYRTSPEDKRSSDHLPAGRPPQNAGTGASVSAATGAARYLVLHESCQSKR
jgi:hypothetical protein